MVKKVMQSSSSSSSSSSSFESSRDSSTQTTVLLVDKDGIELAAALCAILGDRHDSRNTNHVIRVVTVSCHFPMTPWKCHELTTTSMTMTSWTTHVGAPDIVLAEDDLYRAIHGNDTTDDGGVADAIFLCCCSLRQRRRMLQRLVQTLHQCEQQSRLWKECTSSPLVIGVLGPTRNLDWMCREVFATERLSSFVEWHRPLVLCGFPQSPILICRVIHTGLVLVLSRPSHPQTVSMCSSLAVSEWMLPKCTRILKRTLPFATLQFHLSEPTSLGLPPTLSWNRVDPHHARSFLITTLNDSNIILYSCLIHALTTKRSEEEMSMVHQHAGSLVLNVVEEWHVVWNKLKHLLGDDWRSEFDHSAIFGTIVCDCTGNTASELQGRLDMTHSDKRASSIWKYRRIMKHCAIVHVRQQVRLMTMAPPIKDDCPPMLEHVLQSHHDSVLQGMTIVLGLGELLGMGVSTELPMTLNIVRNMQTSLQKEYVLPTGTRRIVASARDIGETMAPQAFGIQSPIDLLRFLRMSPFGENLQASMERRIHESPIHSRSNLSRL